MNNKSKNNQIKRQDEIKVYFESTNYDCKEIDRRLDGVFELIFDEILDNDEDVLDELIKEADLLFPQEDSNVH